MKTLRLVYDKRVDGRDMMTPLRETPLTSQHRKLNAQMAEFASYEMPMIYSSIQEEHLTVRSAVSIFDVSHMGEILIEGKDATPFVESLFTNSLSHVVDGKVVYGLMCNESGGVIDDLLIYKYNDEKYLFVVNAANREKDLAWIQNHQLNYDVTINDISDAVGLIAIQGPKAERVLQQLTTENLSEINPFTFVESIDLVGVKAMVSRTGYTGEDGFEMYAKSQDIVKLWEILLEVGRSEGLKPIGLGARDTLRFEAGLPLYGNELTEAITPLEAGLQMFVKFNHDFIGKKALERQKEEGIQRKIVGLELLDRGIVRTGYPVFNENDERIGEVTTGYLLPGHQKAKACALIHVKYASKDEIVYVQMRKKLLKAKVTGRRFLKK